MTPSEPQGQEVFTDPMENLLTIISELPMAKAMAELQKRSNVPVAVRKVVETMALHKEDLVLAIALIVKRERAVMKLLKNHYDLEQLGAKDIDWSKVKVEFNVD